MIVRRRRVHETPPRRRPRRRSSGRVSEMRRLMLACLPAAIAGCIGGLERGTLAELHAVEPDLEEIEVQDSLDLAMESYRRFLNETPTGRMTPEAMRRLADLQIEKEFGITGDGERWIEMAAPEPGAMPQGLGAAGPREAAVAAAAPAESDEEFEARTTRQHELGFMRTSAGAPADDGLPAAAGLEGPLEAIALYERLLTEYPNYERADQVLYQMARAYDELGRTDEAMEVSERLIREYGYSKYFDEVQFRRGEYFFTRRMYLDAESAYQAITERAAHSEFYELALYKLGWTLYKQELYEEALHQYMALLDYKLSIG